MPENPQPETPPQPTAEPKRKPGRPRKYAPWFPAVAKTMANGTALRKALVWNGIQLDDREIHNLYKNREFVRLYRIERHVYMHSQYGKHPLSELEQFRKRIENWF